MNHDIYMIILTIWIISQGATLSFSPSDTMLSFSPGALISISGGIISLSPDGATGQKKLFPWDSSSLPDKERVAANYFGKDRA